MNCLTPNCVSVPVTFRSGKKATVIGMFHVVIV